MTFRYYHGFPLLALCFLFSCVHAMHPHARRHFGCRDVERARLTATASPPLTLLLHRESTRARMSCDVIRVCMTMRMSRWCHAMQAWTDGNPIDCCSALRRRPIAASSPIMSAAAPADATANGAAAPNLNEMKDKTSADYYFGQQHAMRALPRTPSLAAVCDRL
jgi:hypothetical protein